MLCLAHKVSRVGACHCQLLSLMRCETPAAPWQPVVCSSPLSDIGKVFVCPQSIGTHPLTCLTSTPLFYSAPLRSTQVPSPQFTFATGDDCFVISSLFAFSTVPAPFTHGQRSRLQGELQKIRETGAELHPLNGSMDEIHDTLSGTMVSHLAVSLQPSDLPTHV